MPESTQPLSAQPTPAKPPEHPIADAPATVEACAEDFGSGASARAWAQKQPKHRL